MKKFAYILISIPLFAFFGAGFGLAAQAAAKDAPAFSFTYEDQSFDVDAAMLASWKKTVTVPAGSAVTAQPYRVAGLIDRYLGFAAADPAAPSATYHYDPAAVFGFIKTISNALNIKPVEPELSIADGRAGEFIPPQDGRIVDAYRTFQNAMRALDAGAAQAGVAVSTSTPQTSLASTNSLGIRELVGRGTSSFKGSPNNRRHNIQVGIDQMKGVIIAPGEEFSFNKFLGPVDGEHGFLPELVIKANDTVPEFGGGLCQVSSTTFRAAMAAGLPITERRNHAYPVTYYSPQGTDATIYPGVVDLKFVNDTPGSVLVWPYLKDKDTLVFDFYGTKDSRQVTLETPVQYDKKTDGSMKATWTRLVAKDGQTRTDVFKSTYQSPALFHKEETFPPSATSTPDGTPLHVGTTSQT